MLRLGQRYYCVKVLHFNQGRQEYFAAADSKRIPHPAFFIYFPPLLDLTAW